VRISASDFNGIAEEVVRLKCLDHNNLYIARTLGISYTLVTKILEREVKAYQVEREQMRHQANMELNWLKKPLKEKYERDAKNPKGVSREDAVALLKIIERQHRLFGLDEPMKVDVKHTIEELSDDELNKQLQLHGIDVKQLPAAKTEDSVPVNFVEDAEYVELENEQDNSVNPQQE
jgi:hypothetical protein